MNGMRLVGRRECDGKDERWTEDGEEGEKKKRERKGFQEGRKMGRKMALAPKYVFPLNFRPFVQTLRVFRALAVLGGLGTTLRRCSRTPAVR